MNDLSAKAQKTSFMQGIMPKVRAFWQRITAPADELTDVRERQQAQLLASMTLILAMGNLFGVVTTVVPRVMIGSIPLWSLLALMTVVLLAAYGFSRTRHYQYAAVVAVGILLLPLYTTYFNPPQTDYELLSTYIWLVIPILLGSLFFSYRGQVILSAVTILLIIALPFVRPSFALSVGQPASFLVIAAAIILFVKYQRDQMGKVRRQELRTYNQTLQIVQAVAENMPGIVYQFALRPDRTSYLPYLSQRVTEILGLDPQVLQEDGQILFQMIHPEDRQDLQLVLAESARDLTPLHWQGRFELANGRIIFGQISANPDPQPDGTIVWNGILLDVTDREQAFQEIEAMEARAQIILESVTVPLLISSLEKGTVLYANQLLAEMVRVPLNELIGQNTPDFYLDSSDRQVLLQELKEKGSVSNYEIHLKRSDGDPFWALISIQIFDFQGTSALITTLLDIEDRKVMERQLVERVQQLNFLNDIGLKTEEAPSLDQFMQWAAAHIPQAMPYPEDCTAAIILEDVLYGAEEARQMSRHIVEELRLSGGHHGHIYIAYNKNHEFRDAESALIGDIGRRISSYIENQRLVEETQVRAAELQIVAEIGTKVAATQNIHQLLNEVVDLTKERFHMYHAHIYLLDGAQNTLVLSAGAGEAGKQMLAERRAIPLRQEKSLVAQAARTRRGVIVNDVQHEPGFLPHPLLPDTAAEIAVPVIFGDEDLLGVLDIQSDTVNYFNTGHINIFTTLASQVAVALQNARQAEQTQEALQELRALQQMMTGEGWQAFLTNANRDIAGFAALDDDKVQPIRKDELVTANGNQQALLAPMTVRGVKIGGLGVKNAETMTKEEAELLDTISQQVAEALERARLFEETEIARTQMEEALSETRRRTEELAIINEIVTDLGSSLDMQHSMQIIVDGLAKSIGVEQVRITLLDEDKEYLTIMAEHYNPDKSESALGLKIPLAGNDLTQQVIRTRKPVVIKAVKSDPRVGPVRDMLMAQGIKQLCILPVLSGNDVIGTVGIDILDERQTLSASQMQLAETIVSQAATAVQNSRFFTQIEERAAELAIINDISEVTSAQLELDTLISTVGMRLHQTFDSQNLYIALYDAESNLINFPFFLDKNDGVTELTPLQLGVDGGFTAQIIESGQPLLMTGSVEEAETQGAVLINSKFDVDTYVGVPMIVGNQVIGVIGMNDDGRRRSFTEADQNLLLTLAGTVGVAVQNARLFAETQERAEELAVINQVAEVAAQQLELDQLFTAVHEQIQRAIINDTFYFAIYDKENDQFDFLYFFDEERKYDVAPLPFDPDLEIGKVFTSGQSIILNRTPEQQKAKVEKIRKKLLGKGKPPTNVIFVPLKVGSEIIGVVSAQNYQFATYNQADLTLLGGIANHVALALENIRLFQETQTALTVTESLYNYSRQLNTATNFEDILSVAANPSPKDVADQALLLTFDLDDGGSPEWAEIVAALGEEELPLTNRFYLPDFPLSELWLSDPSRAVLIGDIQKDERIDENMRAVLEPAGIAALAVLPMSNRGIWIGLISLVWTTPRDFKETEQQLYNALATQAASVLHNRLLFKQTDEALAETAALYQASAEINAAANYDDILNALRNHTILGRNINNLSLNYFDRPWTNDDHPEWVEVITRWSQLPSDVTLNRYPLAMFPSADDLLHREQPTIIEDVVSDPRVDENARLLYQERFGAQSTIFIPLVLGNQWVGYINAIYPEKMTFPDQEVRRVIALSRQAAVAIQSIRLLEESLTRARREQMLREISARVRSSADVDNVMRTAVKEIGKALGRRTHIVLNTES